MRRSEKSTERLPRIGVVKTPSSVHRHVISAKIPGQAVSIPKPRKPRLSQQPAEHWKERPMPRSRVLISALLLAALEVPALADESRAAGGTSAKPELLAAFWNVENLFDT